MKNERLTQLHQFLNESPNDVFLTYALAMEYVGLGQASEAIQHLQHVLNLDVNYLGAYYQLGKLYEQSQQTAQALQQYRLGMDKAMNQRDAKTLAELRAAYALLAGEEEEED